MEIKIMRNLIININLRYSNRTSKFNVIERRRSIS